MTNDAYVKASDICKKIENFKELSYIANKPYKRFGLSKKSFWISNYDRTEVVLCDEGLAELIKEYCDKQILELQQELKKL